MKHSFLPSLILLTSIICMVTSFRIQDLPMSELLKAIALILLVIALKSLEANHAHRPHNAEEDM